MQGAALALSPATPALLKSGGHRRRWAAPSVRLGDVAFRAPIHGLGRPRSPLASSCPSSSSSGLGCWNRPLLFGGGKEEFKVRASAVPESAGEGGSSPAAEKAAGGALAQTLQLGALFGLWYLFNIYFNIYNKQVLKVYPYPVTVTTIQFAVGSSLVLFLWITNLLKKPQVSSSQLLAILPLALVHTMGNLFTNMSLGKVAVSFTHTIKAMEPFFSVILSAMFLGETPTIWILLSLLPIVGGVGLASLTEASLDNITLFSVITMMSFFLLAPVALLVEGVKFTPSYLQSAGLNLNEIYVRSLVASLCFHAYQQVSYMILARVSPVTHSVGNCVKRVVVIVTSVLFFRTPVSPINSLGTGIALAGVFLYSWVKRLKPKPQLKSA
ncbi:hypothetical protein Taro_036785 [Colocasia esculenta]|uniref:Sugar phosphate transporter domain-containing protein n=1 Tax=Colocasia esculenta TaxID=4460 RepID=A0A843VYJ2_COLES|nr:hypothetical protein [Colocasia esculenta]